MQVLGAIMAIRRRIRAALLLGAALTLAACEDDAFDFLRGPGDDAETSAQGGASGAVVERDIEAPEVFQTTESGLWDGRPSLGGVWVAHPDVEAPERVLIRNETNEQFVVGALFRREREVPGPRLQVSSDAAEELGMLAGQPVRLNVTALRKETVEQAPETEAPAAGEETAPATEAANAQSVTAAPLDGEEPQPAPAPASSLERPFIQIGIFSVEQNARNAATSLRRDGIVPTVKEQTSSGKTFWRVIVGPAGSTADRAAILEKVKALGYTDAYFVTD